MGVGEREERVVGEAEKKGECRAFRQMKGREEPLQWYVEGAIGEEAREAYNHLV